MSDLQLIGAPQTSVQEFWVRFESPTFSSIRSVVSDDLILEACRTGGYVFRKRKLTPIVMVLHMTLAAIWPEESLAARWEGLWAAACAYDMTRAALQKPGSGALAKARKRLPLAVWEALSAAVAELAAACGAARDTWRGFRLVLIDGTCVSMPATEALFEHFGTSGNDRNPGRFPLARMVVLGLAGSRTILAYALGVYQDSETSLARTLLKHLRPNDLLIADRLFASAHAYVQYLTHGIQFVTRLHQRVKLSKLRKLRIYGPGDWVVEMPLNPKQRRLHPELPETVTVRVIRARISSREGRGDLYVVTSLLSAEDYPAKEIVALYGRRWSVETVLREFKVELSADVLRSQTPAGIAKEIAARVVALNAIRKLMLEAAVQEGVDPLRISFVQTLRTVLSFAPAFALRRVEMLPQLYRRMLAEIARELVPERPGRQEPRMIRRETKHYPTLRQTRLQWRKTLAA